MKILVVDREPDIRGVLDLLASSPGNEVIYATTGQDALDKSEGKHLDILITEVFIEPMNGFTLRNKMENRHGGVRTIFVSGYDLKPYAEHTAGYEVVRKPPTAETLFPAIARALGFGAAPAPAPVAPAPEPEPEPQHAPAAVPVAVPVAVPRATPAPVAVPRATPQPVAVPVAVPKATPAPVAVPVAVPRATPAPVAVPQATAAPVAVPRAVPAPVAVPRATPAPIATPVAVPRATPASVAVPQATPAPVATPVAVPKAIPAPVAVPQAAPAPVATPVAVPKATPAPVAVPQAAPAATPVAAVPKATPAPQATAVPVATPRAAVAATPKAVPVAARPVAADPYIGKTLGSYRVERRLGNGKWGPVYLAIQTSVNRPVAMELLTSDDQAARENFVATARAKAAVQHPHILSVYEADQSDGRYFYTHEYVDGLTLEQLAARGEGLSEPTALQTIKFVAQALSHLSHQHVSHSQPEASDIYIGSDGLPHLSNLALPTGELTPPQDEIRTLGALIRAMLPGGQAQDRGLQAMLMRMGVGNQAGFQSWPALFQAITAIEPKVIPVDAFKLSAQDEAAIRAVEDARKRQKRTVIMSIAGLFVLLWVIAFVVWFEFFRATTTDHSDDMVLVPAGSFIYGTDGEKKTLPDFYIDKYEVTIGEYEKFLEYLSAHGNPSDFDSPLQPAGRTHVPQDWNIIYGRASSSLANYRNFKGVPFDLNCPVFNVDYFDAYAYSRWKGRRLPTEEEWEKAARGPSGNLYTWGGPWDPKKLNSGADYMSVPPEGYKPAIDGYNWWSPVGALSGDKSFYGVMDMGGNVSEWTGTWDPGKTYVVIRGGNFKSDQEEKCKTTVAIRNAGPMTTAYSLGFRTASDKAPGK